MIWSMNKDKKTHRIEGIRVICPAIVTQGIHLNNCGDGLTRRWHFWIKCNGYFSVNVSSGDGRRIHIVFSFTGMNGCWARGSARGWGQCKRMGAVREDGGSARGCRTLCTWHDNLNTGQDIKAFTISVFVYIIIAIRDILVVVTPTLTEWIKIVS